jgi:hypothetical protein
MRRTALCLALLPQLAHAAETPLSGAEFEAYTTGKTLTFASQGQVYGAEQYLPGRRVKWAFTEDICREGTWYEDAGQICFVYDYDPTPQCWIFWQDGGLRARFVSTDSGTELHEVSQSTGPLPCAGPEVGV